VNGLERELTALHVEWPPTPDLVAAIEPRLEARRRRPWLRPLAIALAVAVVVVGAVLAVSPGARSAFLEVFHLKGVTVERVESLPPTHVTAPLDLGTRVSRQEAERLAGFPLAEPSLLGEPSAIYLGREGLITFVYEQSGAPRLLFSQLEARVDGGFLKKMSGLGTRIQGVEVRGSDGLFLSGEPHEVMFVGPNGTVVEPGYLAGTVLLWTRGKVTYRLEGNLSLARALELARSVS